MRHLGVIGYGVVGTAVAEGFAERGFKVSVYDRYKVGLQDYRAILKTDVVFVCVPTPTRDDGTQNVTALEEVFAILKGEKYEGIIVIKSTILPGTTDKLSWRFQMPRTCHNPEFLTAANAKHDFLHEECVLVSSRSEECALDIGDLYHEAGFRNVRLATDPRFTELAKYMHNLFLSIKISFFNEMKEICEVINADFIMAKVMALAEGKIGESHTAVPGPDGKRGFGGACFPKDSKAFLRFAAEKGVQMETLLGAVEGNIRRRPEAK